jgi:hypothetical protein
VERITLKRLCPTVLTLLKSFPKTLELQEPTFRDVVVVYRSAGERGHGPGAGKPMWAVRRGRGPVIPAGFGYLLAEVGWCPAWGQQSATPQSVAHPPPPSPERRALKAEKGKKASAGEAEQSHEERMKQLLNARNIYIKVRPAGLFDRGWPWFDRRGTGPERC